MKTRSIKKNEIDQKWYIVDITGIRLGKASQAIAKTLIGKDKVTRSPNLENGDKVVVINSDKVDYFNQREWRKKYYSHSTYPGGFKEITLGELMKKDSRKVIEKAVWGMLPKTKRGREMMANLKIYKDENYIETAQKPEKLDIK